MTGFVGSPENKLLYSNRSLSDKANICKLSEFNEDGSR